MKKEQQPMLRNDKVCFTKPIAFNMEQEELALTGTHNLFNSMAAGISANLAGIRKECIREALGDFKWSGTPPGKRYAA